MGLMDTIQDAVASAFTALDDMAQYVSYHSIGIVHYEPNSGENIEEGGTDYQVWVVPLEYSLYEVDGEVIKPEDKKIMIKGDAIPFTPKNEDTLEIDSIVYRVVNVKTDPAKAAWTVQGRPYHEDTITAI